MSEPTLDEKRDYIKRRITDEALALFVDVWTPIQCSLDDQGIDGPDVDTLRREAMRECLRMVCERFGVTMIQERAA